MRLVVLLVLCVAPLFALGQTERLLIATVDYYPAMYVENDRLTGSNTEVVRAVFECMGVQPEFAIFPWVRALHELEAGNIDALFSGFKTAERMAYVDYSDPIDSEILAMFVLADSKIEYDGDPQQLVPYTFGLTRGHSAGAMLDKLIENQTISIWQHTLTTEKALGMLLLGRFDILPMDRRQAWVLLTQWGKTSQVRELSPHVGREELHVMFSKKRNHTGLIKRFNQALAELKEDGTYQQIMRGYAFGAQQKSGKEPNIEAGMAD